MANPIDIVYNRQVADSLYPKGLQRGYTSFIDGLTKVHTEGALFRGAIASGMAYGMLNGGMSQFYDFCKEWFYWIFGPSQWLRPMILIPTAALGVSLYLPFDNIRTRFHTMTPLPNGDMPYKSTTDAFFKILKYEGDIYKYSSPIAFLNGGMPAFVRLFVSLLIGINLTDYAYRYNHFEGELWEPATVHTGHQQGYIPHEPAYIERYNTDFTPIKVKTKPEQNISLGSGTNSYIKY